MSALQYKLDVDRNARFRNVESVFESRNFYGQLQHIYILDCPPIPSTTHTTTTPIIFAVIRTCATEETHPSLDIHYYTNHSTLNVLDITTIQGVVGRIRDRGRWAIIDRSGALSRAIYNGDDQSDDEQDD